MDSYWYYYWRFTCVIRRSDGSGSVIVDDAETTGTIGGTLLITPWKVGDSTGTTATHIYDIVEWIIYRKALSATEVAAIRNYLNKRYDLY